MIYYSIEMEPIEPLEHKIDVLEENAIQEMIAAQTELAQKIVTEIKQKYVPVYMGGIGKQKGTKGIKPSSIRYLRKSKRSKESGVLRDSVGYEIRVENGQVVVIIFAGRQGSGAEEYAAVQHENLMYRHNIGQAKYIEVPVTIMSAQSMSPIIVKHIQNAMSQFKGFISKTGQIAETPSTGGTGLL